VRDLWNHIELGRYDRGFSTTLLGHGVRLLKVEGEGAIRTTEWQSYEAESATLNGSAVIAACPACSGGEKVGGLALGLNNNVTFNNVVVRRDGVYQMRIDSMTQGPRSLIYSVNGGPLRTLNVGGGSFFLPSSTTVSVGLHSGTNSIEFGSPTSYPPDMDRIVISGNGSGAPPLPKSTTYEAENATLAGTVTPPYCQYCSGAGEAGNIGGGNGNTVTFTNVNVDTSGTYQMEVDYLTAAPRSFFISVNGAATTELDLNGSSWSLPASTVIPVQLQAGSNTIQFGNNTGYAPALDRIAIAPVVESSTLTGTILGKTGSNGLRIWTVSLNNSGPGRALGTQINTFSVTQTAGAGSCHPKALLPLPIELKSIPPGGHAEVDVPIDFSRCTESAQFNVSLVFSADNGAEVGNFAGSGETR
jgi:alpha-galactosidase